MSTRRNRMLLVLISTISLLGFFQYSYCQDGKQEHQTDDEKRIAEISKTLSGSWVVDRKPTLEANQKMFEGLKSQNVEQILSMTLTLDSDGKFIQKSGTYKILGTWSIELQNKEEESNTKSPAKCKLTLDPENLGDHHNMYFEIEFSDKTHFKSVPNNATGTLFFVKEAKLPE